MERRQSKIIMGFLSFVVLVRRKSSDRISMLKALSSSSMFIKSKIVVRGRCLSLNQGINIV